VKRERITGRELTPEEKRSYKCTIELNLEEVEYLENAVHSHMSLHEKAKGVPRLDVPWEIHLKIAEMAYNGSDFANKVQQNLRSLAYAMREEDQECKGIFPTSSSE